MRLDPYGNPLHVRMHYKHGSYYYVQDNQWHKLGQDYASAMQSYAAWMAPTGGMAKLIDDTYKHFKKRTTLTGKQALSTTSYGVYLSHRERIDAAFVEFSPTQVKPKHISGFLDFYFFGQPSLHNGSLTVLRHIFERGKKMGVCEFNPAKEVKAEKPNERDRYISDEEFNGIRAEAKPYLKLIMDACLLTGQRIGDVLHIKQSDITDEGIFFQQQKTKKRLLIESTPTLQDIVREARGLSKVAGVYLFTRTANTPMVYSTVLSHWNKATAAAGVEDAHIHDLRAKAITDADAEGLDAQALAGHFSKAMTERYLRLLRTDRVQSPSKVAQLRQNA